MAGVGKPLHLRLFLEGQEVPVVSAQVQFGLWAPATAAIQIVPIDEGLEFKARTMVHLFYLEEPKSAIKAGEVRRESVTLGLNGAMGDSAYKLFFAGEVAGFSFVKTPMSRAIVLQCMDFSSYWDSVQATMMDYGPQGNAMVSKAAVYGSDSSVFANVPSMNQAEKLRSWIMGHAKTKGLDTVGGLAGGILNMVETMGGIRGSVLGVNDFFTIAELRCHILSQIVAEEGDNTSKKLLDVSVFFDFIHNNFQNQPGQVTLRDMMKMLCAYIYYSFVPNPVAKFEVGDGKKTVTYGPKDIALSQHRNFGSCMAVVTEATRVFPMSDRGTTDSTAAVALASDIAKTLVPKLKQMQKDVSIDQSLVIKAEQLGQEVGRYNTLVAKMFGTTVEEARKTVAGMANTLWDQFSAASKTQVRQPGGSYTIDSAARLKAHVFRPDCFMAAPPTCNVIFPEQYSQISYDRAFLTEVTRVEVSVFNHVVGQDALTASHFVEPHMLDMSKAVVAQMSHKWRVLMDHERHTGIIAREEWLPDSFSSLRQPKGETAAKLKQASTSWTQKTGLHHFFKYRIGPRTMNVAGRFMPQVVCGFPALIIQKPFYLPNSTVSDIPQDQAIDRILKSSNPAVELGAPPQFLGMVESVSHALSQDGGNSSLSLSHCRSHLGIDDEFIGSVLDKVKSQSTTKTLVRYTITYEQAKKDGKLKQFLLGCTPQSLPAESQMMVVERTVTSSEAQFIHTTTVGGKKSSTKKTVNVKTSAEKSVKKAVNGSTTAAPDPHSSGATIHVPAQNGTVAVGSKGMRGGTIKLIEVLAPYDIVEEESKGAVAGTEWAAPEAAGAFGGRSDVPATPAYSGPKWRFFRGVTVFEEIALTTSEITPVPVEYVVQPAWMSTSYDNENIGPKIYQPFFGCSSIVDAISLSNTGSIPERAGEDGAYASPYEDDAALRARLQDTHNKRNFYSIEKAANLIAYLYGKVKSGKADVSEFVDSYTWRKVATKLEILGSYDLEIGFKKDVPFAKTGKLGFHTLSVHPEVVKKGKLIGLLDDPTWKGTRMNGSQKSAVAASYDVRAEKLAKVEKYIQVLKDGARGYVG